MHIEGVGDVCSLAAFDFQVRCSCSGVRRPHSAQLPHTTWHRSAEPVHRSSPRQGSAVAPPLICLQRHGNVRYGSPLEAPKAWRSRQGKMEKSLITFAGAGAVGSGVAGMPPVHWACTITP